MGGLEEAKPSHKFACVRPGCGLGVRKGKLACVWVARWGTFLVFKDLWLWSHTAHL